MIPAPVMILGVIAGVLLCFSGNPLKRFWFPLRCFLFGAAIMLLGVQLILDWPATASLFEAGATFRSFFTLITTDAIWWHTLLKVLASVGGGVAFFFLGRAKNRLAVFITKILTAFTTGCTAALLIAAGGFGVVTVPMACVIAGVLTIALIPVCIARFDYYYAAETGLAGALVTSYMFARFYYFSSWLFWLIAVLLAFCGIYLQERAAIRRRAKDATIAQTAQSTSEVMATKPPVKKRRSNKAKTKGDSASEPVLEFVDAPVETSDQVNTENLSPAEKIEEAGSVDVKIT